MSEKMKQTFEKKILGVNNPEFLNERNFSREFGKKNTSTLVSLFDTLKTGKIIDSKLDKLESKIG